MVKALVLSAENAHSTNAQNFLDLVNLIYRRDSMNSASETLYKMISKVLATPTQVLWFHFIIQWMLSKKYF